MSGWLGRLRSALGKSANRLADGITGIFTGDRKLDDDALESLEELLITADLGVGPAARLAAALGKRRFEKGVTPDAVREALAEEIARLLDPVAKPLAIGRDGKPHVVMVVGVNGTGKTTTIGKLAKQLSGEGHKVMLAAGDTFRAAAIEQLQIWGERVGAPVIAGKQGGDAAALAFDALEQAEAAGSDVLLLDTAGRLHNKKHLMDELAKIRRVLGKRDAEAPHDRILVLDATTGQNALQQVQTFQELTEITGLVVTKLDGSARGGVVVALAERFGLPVHAIGVGEGADDLRPFKPDDFARSLLGLDAG